MLSSGLFWGCISKLTEEAVQRAANSFADTQDSWRTVGSNVANRVEQSTEKGKYWHKETKSIWEQVRPYIAPAVIGAIVSVGAWLHGKSHERKQQRRAKRNKS
jgi:hypothetical protein